MTQNLSEEDEGKDIVDSNGERIGMVKSVESGTAYVDADPDLTDSIKSSLGWGDVDQDDYKLEGDQIDTVTDDEIRLST